MSARAASRRRWRNWYCSDVRMRNCRLRAHAVARRRYLASIGNGAIIFGPAVAEFSRGRGTRLIVATHIAANVRPMAFDAEASCVDIKSAMSLISAAVIDLRWPAPPANAPAHEACGERQNRRAHRAWHGSSSNPMITHGLSHDRRSISIWHGAYVYAKAITAAY